MKQLIAGALASLLLIGCGSGKKLAGVTEIPIAVQIDLTAVANDQLTVSVDPGAFPEGPIRFAIPKTVPGTYSEDNYGRYVESLTAYGYQGETLEAVREDDNTWLFSNGAALDRISYVVNDSYDSEDGGEAAPFSPAGTNILEGQHFMLNLHGFVGYFGTLKEIPYVLNITAPADLKPVTTLPVVRTETGNYQFNAGRYFDVIDNPMQWAKSDPVSFNVGDIEVILSVYSPNGVYTASDLKPSMEKMMQAQKNFLGDIDGTKQYAILLYLSTLEGDAMGFGALEHHTSTVVVLPEQMPKDQLEQTMVDVVSHEFFHIVTPLNIHSEEVQYFDYNDPKMSRHLWMYEGTTEYFANIFQIREGLIDNEEFYDRIVGKIQNSMRYNDSLSFTEMSANVLDPEFEDEYANVYEKGALINMVLDIRLRQLSGGSYGVLDLMKELAAKYDVDTPFKDEALFDEIVAMTYPEIRSFFEQYVIGDTPIPYATVLEEVGLNMGEQEVASGYFLKDLESQIPFIDVDPENTDIIFVREGFPLNTFFTGLGAQGGDIIKNINGTDITLDAIRNVIGQSFGWTADTDITMVVERDGELITLEGKAGTPTFMEKGIFEDSEASEGAVALRKAWMGK